MTLLESLLLGRAPLTVVPTAHWRPALQETLQEPGISLYCRKRLCWVTATDRSAPTAPELALTDEQKARMRRLMGL